MTELRVTGLGHTYPRGGVRALDAVDLRVGPGERVAIVGQNGSGKTTLARHLNGLLRPTEGRVLVDGIDARLLSVAQLSRRVGLVFQDPDRQLFAATVHAEVAFGPRNLGLRGGQLADAVHEGLAMTGLADDERAHPYDLGLSRRKLLAIASVLAMRTPMLVLDEPTTGQDARGVERVRSVVSAVAGEDRTVIAISHDMRFVASTFDRLVVMRAGRIVLDAPPREALAATNWETLGSTYLEPPLSAVLGEKLGVGTTPTDEALIAALSAQ